MKRLFGLILAVITVLSLCACKGSMGRVNLNEPLDIPEDGIIDKNTVEKIKTENAIAVFIGNYGGLKYEWTVFGSKIENVKEVNLGIELKETEDGNLKVVLAQKEDFGFSASLAIHPSEQWKAQTATAYDGDKAIASVSITGSKNTILNLNLDGTVSEFIITPDPLPEDAVTEESSAASVPEESEAEESEPEENVEKDTYLTDPVPEGKPEPVEPETQVPATEAAYTCYISIECSTILNNLDMLDPAKLEMVPSDGYIFYSTAVSFYEGESVYDVLQRVSTEYGIHMESEFTPIYNSAYVEGINNLYEFDCGALSGWMYRVNGWYPNYGCSRYLLKDGDEIEWRYTCDLGQDVGGAYAVGGQNE